MLIETYGKMYFAAFHENADINYPRDMALAKDLLKKYSFATLAQYLRAFFDSTDEFIRKTGYTFPMFKQNISKLITDAASVEHLSKKSIYSMVGIYGKPAIPTPIRDALAFLAVEFRAEVDTPQTRTFERTLKELAEQKPILMLGAQLLVDEAANGRQFYPIPKAHDLKGACQKVIEKLRLEAFNKGVTGCDHPHYLEEITREDGSTVLQRCSCYKRGKLAMEAIAKPLALPAPSGDFTPIVPEESA